MGQALYRKYRSRSLKEIVGQDHITKTLDRALKQDKIRHAYLFTGPRGVGKTSIARILAHEINDLPYSDDTPHIDIIEIDAASNRRIDEIRELRDKVYIAPISAKYKVYIIDEVHMLTREAFNALLKTLEEPPEHAVFILATTDAHKLPDTIISRTQRFTFRPVEKTKVSEHLAEIAKKEKIKVTGGALELLAEHGEGSFRDSISLLDQASSSGGDLDEEAVYRLLGVPPKAAIESLSETISSGGASREIVRQLTELYDQGYQASSIAKQLAHVMRDSIIEDRQDSDAKTIKVLSLLLEVPIAHDPDRYLEIILLEYASLNAPQKTVQKTAVEPEPAPEATDLSTEESIEVITDPEVTTAVEKEDTSHGTAVLDEALWPQVLLALKTKYNTLYGIVRMAQPRFISPDHLELACAFAFHQKRLNETSNRAVIAKILQKLTGREVQIDCILDPKAKPAAPEVSKPRPAANEDLTAISNIFGGAELLES
jgi:DNA polymerase-3 subunit gamma/tau